MVSILNYTYPIHETVFKRSLVKLVTDHFFLHKEGGGRFFTVRTETTIMYREWKCNFSIIQQRIKYIIFNYEKKTHASLLFNYEIVWSCINSSKKNQVNCSMNEIILWNYIIAMVFSEIDIIVILALINEVEGLLITMGWTFCRSYFFILKKPSSTNMHKTTLIKHLTWVMALEI